MKTCSKCGIQKPKKMFYMESKNQDKLSRWCIDCHKKYIHSVDGVITQIYSAQIKTSKKRNHNPPSYSKDILKLWITTNDKFLLLYNTWVSSNYNKDLKPSIDRIDDYKGYSIDNIQLMTWGENRIKGFKDRVNGINNKTNKKVAQFDNDDNLLNVFYSISDASRKTGIDKSSINKAANGKRQTAGGFKWKIE